MSQTQFAPLPIQTSVPLLLAYPRVYQNMLAPEWVGAFDQVLAKCVELATRRPTPENRHGGFFGLGRGSNQRLRLFTIWGDNPAEFDIFIIAGSGDGFGPGHTCPRADALRSGDYGPLIPVPLLS